MIALLLFLIFVGAQFFAGILAIIISHPEIMTGEAHLEGLKPTAESLGMALFLVEGLACLLFALWFKLATRKQNPSSVPSPRPLGRQGLYAVPSVLLLSFGLSLVLERFDLSDGGMQAQFAEMISNPLCLLLLCVVGPLTEELFFRAGILRELHRAGLPGLGAAVISAFSFAVVHGNAVQGIPAFVIGVVFGLFYLRTGNLRLCLPAHMANNVLAVVLMAIPGGMTFTENWSLAVVLALGLICMASGIYGTWRVLK